MNSEFFHKKIKNKKILLIGDIILDEFLYGETFRVSPEAPVPIVKFIESKSNLGGAGNVFVNLNSLKLNVNFISILGRDKNSKNNYRFFYDK
jgi:D-beta-D-heptose 7-phosphate kinase/D-beta-D-heptose 1-phosphate adenosyltransferase